MNQYRDVNTAGMSAVFGARTGQADAAGQASNGHACPCCEGTVYRVPRRLRDLLLSIFISVGRYRCRSVRCGWEGNLRLKGQSPLGRGRVEQYDGRSCAFEPSRMGCSAPAERMPR